MIWPTNDGRTPVIDCCLQHQQPASLNAINDIKRNYRPAEHYNNTIRLREHYGYHLQRTE